MDFRERLRQGSKSLADNASGGEPEDAVTSAYFALDRSTCPVCLELRLAEGTRVAVPYTLVTEIHFSADKGIEVHTPQNTIRIIGRNLAKLFDGLVRYRVRFIQVDIGTDMQENGLFVGEISIGRC